MFTIQRILGETFEAEDLEENYPQRPGGRNRLFN